MNHFFAVQFVARAYCRLIGLQLPPTSCLRVQSSASETVKEKDPVPRFMKWCLTLRFPHEYSLWINWLKSIFRKNSACMAAI